MQSLLHPWILTIAERHMTRERQTFRYCERNIDCFYQGTDK